MPPVGGVAPCPKEPKPDDVAFHQQTDSPIYADDRNYYKVEKWTNDGAKVDHMLYALQLKPVGMTMWPMDFHATLLILRLGEAFVLRTQPTPLKSVDLPRETMADRVSLFDLRKHHCRWPVGGDGAAVLFCGADKYGDHPYCARHCHKAYSSMGARAAEKQRWLQRQKNRAA